MSYLRICERCNGSGYIEVCYECPDCGGIGEEVADDDEDIPDEDFDEVAEEGR